MDNYRQNVEHELAAMIAGLGFVFIIGCGFVWFCVFVVTGLFQ